MRTHAEVLQRGVVPPQGQVLQCPPPVEYRGYQLNEITMVPRPKHLPVEIWMPIASGRTIDMMAQQASRPWST